MKFVRQSIPFLSLLVALSLAPFRKAEAHSFEAGDGMFLLDGKPFVVKAAEVHYPRIPRPYWEQRIRMCKALGMNTLCIYIFWNAHEQEEGVFDFTGNNDIRAFVKLAQKEGMYVILRPGPYVCAEWEMGGLPWWLLKKKDISLREQDPYFMERLELFEAKVGEQLSDLTIEKGGPIIMVQVENEYGSYGEDKEYVSAVRDIIRGSGFDGVQLFQCDWSSNFTKNALDDLLWTMNFGTGANVDNEFKRLKELRPDSPLMCSEFWSGWFDKWGGRHETRGAEEMVSGIRDMLDRGISFSLYMTHGGTNWGHWAGANSPGFAPDVTSYDYDAPINEAGQTTDKYWELRRMMAEYTDGKLPPVPKEFPVISIPKIEFNEVAPLYDNLGEGIESVDTKTFEELGQGWGCLLYRTTVPQDVPSESVLTVTEAHDYAQVFLNQRFIGKIDRINHETSVVLPQLKEGDVLDIYVEALGRINFGSAIKDFKGITEKVELTYTLPSQTTVTMNLKGWAIFPLPDDYQRQRDMAYVPLTEENKGVRGNYRATFTLGKVGDTFLNLETWGKGQVYVNGHAIGRFWQVGPQQTLYMPGCWLRKGENEIIVTDVLGPTEAAVEGLTKPIIDKLQLSAPQTHRLEGQTLDLSGETPVQEGSLEAGNGWQEVRFASNATGRYVCIEALNSHWDREYCCIAELYLLDADGQRLSREPWQVAYADDEDVTSGNKNADKLFDLQESTYWSTNKGVPYPHAVVIDLGQDKTLSGFQILPRMEQGAPESIKDYRIYVSSEPFKM
ncbi:MAG: beta-galactosidase [Prevotellaceae bacterium]|nr:beta-galactosidase [Prevotellaceae bacterium]